MDLKGKIVVITGATGGIGSCMTKEFDKEGANLILISRDLLKLKYLLKKLKGKGHKIFACDFNEDVKTCKIIENISDSFDKIDILINCAGTGVYKNLEDVELADWESSINVNVSAPFMLIRGLIEILKKAEKALVFNIGSGMGKIPTAGRSVYCASKFALRGLSMSLSEEFRNTNVSFIHIDLGSTLTGFGPVPLEEKIDQNLRGKAYFTPDWVAKKIIEIIKNDDIKDEITLYPSEYDKECSLEGA